ncbi:MAG TPA: universal stress protein [Solirubrobacterales bacterium]|nr:universal stress protein [Solirubrobacterales bacterium]
MAGKVVVGYLETEPGHDALALGTILARATDAELRVVTVDDADELGPAALAEGADVVVLGSTHRGPLGRIVPGPALDHLLAQTPCRVAVAPPGFAARTDGEHPWEPLDGNEEDVGMRVIGVGYDGTAGARAALEFATNLALANGATLRLYTVVPKVAPLVGDAPMTPTPMTTSELDRRRAELHEVAAGLPAETRALAVVLRGYPVPELLKAAGLGVDLLVLGTHVRGHVRRVLHKGVAGEIVMEANCPVLICPTPVAAPTPVA